MPDRVKNEIIEKWISLCYDKTKLFVRKKIQNYRIPLIAGKVWNERDNMEMDKAI